MNELLTTLSLVAGAILLWGKLLGILFGAGLLVYLCIRITRSICKK